MCKKAAILELVERGLYTMPWCLKYEFSNCRYRRTYVRMGLGDGDQSSLPKWICLGFFNAAFKVLRVVDVRNKVMSWWVRWMLWSKGPLHVSSLHLKKRKKGQGKCGPEHNGIYVQRVVRVKLIADLMQ